MRWLTVQREYTDGVVMPASSRVPEPYDLDNNPENYSQWDIAGTRASAARNNLNRLGERSHRLVTYIVSWHGALRVINEHWTTETRPNVEAEPYRRTQVHADRDVRVSSAAEPSLQLNRGDVLATAPSPVPLSTSAGDSLLEDDKVGMPPVEVAVDDAPAVPACDLPNRGVPHPDLKSCGIVCVVDFMSLLYRAFKAGTPSKVHGVRSMLETICHVIERICPEFLIFAMDDPGPGHRNKIYPDYKANREAKPPELLAQIEIAKQALNAIGWPSICIKGWEADDVLASVATQLDAVSIGVVMVTSDKDALQTCATTRARVYHPWGEGLHFNETRCDETYGVPFSMMNGLLALMGDTSDNIPGVPGIGKKTAATLMRTHRTFEAVLQAAQEGKIDGKVGKSLQEHADQAKLSRDLVTLRTDLPIGKLWEWWPLDEPRPGWQRRLQDLGLGGVAQKLAKLLPTQGKSSLSHFRSETTHHEVIHVVEIPDPVPASLTTDHGVASNVPDEERRFSDAAADDHSVQLPESVPIPDAVISAESDVESWYPGLYACPANASLLDTVRAVYRTGLDHYKRGRMPENGWKREYIFYAAFDDGLNGRPLTVQLSDYDAAGYLLKRVPLASAAAESGQPRPAMSLF